MRLASIRAGLCACLVAVLLSGCAVALIGGGAALAVGAVAYKNGQLDAMDDVLYGNAWTAAQKAMTDLEYTTVSEKKDALQGEIVAQTGDGTKVHVVLKKMNDKTTKISIRYGTFGDEIKSRLILEKIRARY